MNRTFLLVFIILIIIFLVLFVRFKVAWNKTLEIQNFNYEYEYYDGNKVNGLDITTLINKATSNNEKYGVTKDKDGYYDVEDTDCIEINISLIVDENGNSKTYKMETFNKVGMNSFISSYADAQFKCIDKDYHKSTGKIKSMTFEMVE